jgi:large subunit ribosomal protein L31
MGGAMQGMRCSMRKKGLHPQIYEDAKVYCNGELVLVTGGTKPEYTVDVWSGNHPYYVGDTSALVVMDSQIEKFRKKWGHIKEYWPEDQWREMHPDGDPEFEPEGDN